jgi:hypothetical protein
MKETHFNVAKHFLFYSLTNVISGRSSCKNGNILGIQVAPKPVKRKISSASPTKVAFAPCCSRINSSHDILNVHPLKFRVAAMEQA